MHGSLTGGPLLRSGTHLVLLAGAIAIVTACRPSRPPTVDPTARLEERRQRSVTEDPAAMGRFPDTWLIPLDGPGVRQEPESSALDDDEIKEFAERFRNSKAPEVLEADLQPGASRILELRVDGPSGLAGSAQWIGTSNALATTIAVDGVPLTRGTAYRTGSDRGGAQLRAQTPVGGRATLVITNTSPIRIKVRLMLVATAR